MKRIPAFGWAAAALLMAWCNPAGAQDAVTPKPPDAAEPGHRLVWDERWPRFRIIEYGVTATLAVELALLQFAANSPSEPHFGGGVLFDDRVRSAMRLETRSAREAAGLASDITAVTPIYVQALLVDGLVIPLLFDDWNGDIALQLEMMNFLSLGTVGVLSRIGHRFVGRARPNAPECHDAPESDAYCLDPYDSFPAGHPAGAFTGAGLNCAHHTHLRLYGSRALDITLGCALPLLLATATGVLRIAADQHYTTDVLLGSSLGFAAGFGLPLALHYGFGGTKGTPLAEAFIVPVSGPGLAGASMAARF